MKKLIYSLIALAGLFTLASCQPDKLIDGAAYGEGTVNATFSVVLGAQTKAFADGTTVDKLYAGIYELGAADEYTWIADNADAPIAISAGAASVTFNGKIALGKSYKVVFWAQKQGAPYAIDWAKSATTGPTVTVTATGAANDEVRDAFFGMYETGAVTGSIDLTGSPVTLKRPFSQVNVLVPTANFVDATAAITSSMSIAQAPTVLNLATKETSDPADWTFSAAAIDEAAFGNYASTHKYVAMNYVLVDQTAADPRYDVTFSATSGSQVAADKQVKNTPLKPNGRTNIVGNIFDTNFNITVPIVIDPGANPNQELTQVTVAVGGMDENNAISLTDAYNQGNPLIFDVTLNHPVEVEADKPQITVTPASVATAEWVIGSGLKVTPLVADGKAVITLVFPAVTKTDYSAATVQIYIKVGNGKNPAAAPTFSPAAGEIPAGTAVVISSETEGATIHFTVDGSDPTSESQTYDSNSAGVVINEPLTLKAIAIKDGYSDSAISTAAYTIAAKPAQTLTVKVGEDVVGAELDKTYGDAEFSLTVTGHQGALSYISQSTDFATISDNGVIQILKAGSSVITVSAAETNDYAKTDKVFTLLIAKKASSLSLNSANATVTVGGTVEVGYTAETDGTISVTTNSTASAVVDAQNNKIVITGETAGSTILNVSIAEGTNYAALAATQSIAVTVNENVKPVVSRTSEASVALTAGETSQIVASRTPDNAPALTYSSNDTDVATVSDTGLITAVGQGNATITISTPAATGFVASDPVEVAVTVNAAAPSVQLRYATITSVPTNSYGTRQEIVDNNYSWNHNGQKAAEKGYVQLNDSGNYYIELPIVPGIITKVVAEISGGSGETPGSNPTNRTVSFFEHLSGSAVVTSNNGSEAASTVELNLPGGSKVRNGFLKVSGGAVRFYSITVYYTADAATVSSISITKATTHTSFNVGDNFVFDGEVTATYSISSTADVTYLVQLSGYNMTSAGNQTVTLTYDNKTTSYEINVASVSYKSATYTVATTTSVNFTGVIPENSAATYSQTHGTASQITKGNSITLTLSGYGGKKIVGAIVSVKSNASGGTGSLDLKTGDTTIASIATAAFNTVSWNGSYSTTYVDKVLDVTDTTIAADATIVLTISATVNSLYFESLTIQYE